VGKRGFLRNLAEIDPRTYIVKKRVMKKGDDVIRPDLRGKQLTTW
jgi:hypothetical protein